MQYKRSILTFLDILGFKQLVDGNSAADVCETLQILQAAMAPGKELAEMLEMSFVTFSDCTIRSVRVDSEANKKLPNGILFFELQNLVHTQARLIHEEKFIRGGVTIGDAFIDGRTVFGPAINIAYGLESEFAVYPRIVIDPILLDAFEHDPLLRHHDLDTERDYLRPLIRRDSDGLYFVDYLRGMLTEFDEEGQEFEFFAEHKALIVAHAEKHKGLNRIAAKFLWAAAYHNASIHSINEAEFERYGLDRDEYLIHMDEMPLLYAFDGVV